MSILPHRTVGTVPAILAAASRSPRLTSRLAMGLTLALNLALVPAAAQAPAAADAAPDAGPAAEPSAARAEALQQLMTAAGIPGLSTAEVEGSEIVWSGAFGVLKAGEDRPVDEETVFEAASLTKPVVAHVALQLMEAGQLDLDRPLVAYLGKAVEPDVQDDPRFLKITARHVLSHSTGFPNWRRQNKLTIGFEPGSQFSYSGEGFVLLARALEAISGQTLEDLVRVKIFQPLKMSHSSLVWQPIFNKTAATGHDELSVPQEKVHPEEPNAAASLHTTARDYAHFLAEILQPTRLKPETVGAMLTPQVQVGEEPALHWGLGWGLEGTAAPYAFWHWGDNGFFRCLTVGAPADLADLTDLADPADLADLAESGMDHPRGRAFIVFTNSWNGLSIAEKLIDLFLQPEQPYDLAEWTGYDPYDSPTFRLRRELLRAGLEGGGRALKERARALRKALGREAFQEASLNNLGYTLLGREDPKAQAAGLAVFRMNVDLYPDSWNAYDSLAEGYMRTGDRKQAIRFYRESLRRNPENENGRRMLEELETAAVAPKP